MRCWKNQQNNFYFWNEEWNNTNLNTDKDARI